MIKRFHIFQIITGIPLFLTLLLAFPETMKGLEEDGLFLFTGEYIAGVLARPQGMASLIANYAEQFFSAAAVGPLVYTLLILASAGILRIALRKTGKGDLEWLAVLPAPLIMLFRFPDLMPSLSFLFFALAFCGFVSLKNAAVRCAYALALPVLAFMFVPWAAMALLFLGFSLIELLVHKKKAAACVMLIAVCESLIVPSLWSDFVDFIPFDSRPLGGFGEEITFGVALTYAATVAVLSCPMSFSPKKWIGFAVVAAFSAFCCISLAMDGLHTDVERLQKVAHMADKKDWSGILLELSPEDCRRNKAYMCYSMLAESALGSFPHNLMNYSVNDPESFLFRREKNLYLLNFNRQFFENIGVWDEAFRQAFEYGVNSRENECFKSLRFKTDYALASHDLGTAEKYISLLRFSSANGAWAAVRAARLDSLKRAAPAEHPYRSDTFVDAYPIPSTMIRLLERDRKNRKVLDYLLCGLLLQKEVDKFGIVLKEFNLYDDEGLPRLYAEAAVALSFKDSTVRQLAGYNPELESQYADFVNRARNGEDCTAYTGTYWYYLAFAHLPENKDTPQR